MSNEAPDPFQKACDRQTGAGRLRSKEVHELPDGHTPRSVPVFLAVRNLGRGSRAIEENRTEGKPRVRVRPEAFDEVGDPTEPVAPLRRQTRQVLQSGRPGKWA